MKQLNKTLLFFVSAILCSNALLAQVPHNHPIGLEHEHVAQNLLEFNPQVYPFDNQHFRDSMIAAGTEAWEVEKYIQVLKDRLKDKNQWQKKLMPPNPHPQGAGQPCDNANFEYGMLASWDCYTGTYGNGRQAYQANPGALNPLRHAITTGPSTDPYGNFPIVEPSGGLFSCRLGNDQTGAQAEVIEQIFMVTNATTSFTYQYAVVLQDPNHGHGQQPYFKIDMLDVNGQPIPCALYNVESGVGIPGFQAFNGGWYKTWTTVNIDLTGYVGQNVTIRFETGDCSQGGHFGYAYIDGDCLPFYITASDTLCSGESVQLIAPPGAQSYLWNPGGQNTQIITVSQPGLYSVQSTSITGCPNPTLNYYINQYPDPAAAAIANPVPCTLTVNFQDNTTIPNNFNNTSISQWAWDFDNDGTIDDNTQNPSHTYGLPGNYTVTLAVQTVNGCKDTVTLQVAVFANPLASFTNTTVCQGTATAFTDGSTTTAGVINAWAWDFDGDNITDAITQNPTFVFPAAGTYPVKLTITTNFGCSDDTIINVTVNPNPVSAFTSTSVCEGTATQFTDQSTITNGNTVTGWTWNFGDGTPNDLTQNPSHTYATWGTYSVTLDVTSNNGCPGTHTQQVIVYPNPVADFTYNSPCLGQPTTFTDISTVANGNVINGWSWNFGDGGTDITQNPSHTYINPGNYNVTLTVTTTNGCTGTIVHQVVVNPTATALFTSSSVCQGNLTQFTDQSTVGNGNTITGWSWDFNDGSPLDITQNPTHLYAVAGNYQVMLTVTTNNGCQGQITQQVTVHPNPVALFTSPAVCLGSAMQFTDQSTVTLGNTVNGWAWDFDGNGTTDANTQNPTFIYPAVGTYTVILTVTTNNGCTDSIHKQVTVNPNPVALFINTTECVNTATVFTDQSTVVGAGNTVTGWAWDFGDGSPVDNTQNPTHTYAAAGTYNVQLTATTNNTCTNAVIQVVTVNPAPQPAFTNTTVCLNNLTNFTDQTAIGNGNTITGWAWDFGDGSPIDNNQNPVHMYTTAGIFQVTLTATSNNNCPASITQAITIHPLPVAVFTATDVCLGGTMNFTDQSTVPSGTVNGWDWDFGDATAHDLTQNPTHVYAASGVYNVTLIASSNNGCLDTLTKQVMVFPNPLTAFTGVNLTGCSPVCATFTDGSTISSGTIIGWDWDFGDGSAHGTTQNPNHCYTAAGTYSVTLTTTSDMSCKSTVTITDMIRVDPYPVAEFVFTPQPTTIRDPKIYFTDKSFGATKWAWDFGDVIPNDKSDISSEKDPSYNYTQPGTYQVKLLVTNTYGCTDTVSASLTIGPDFSFYVPNAFTPNGDGVNDGFIGKGEGIQDFEMSIYNRWGETLYRTQNLNEPWDGTAKFRTVQCQQDVYVYKIRIRTIFGEMMDYVGDVTLVR
jgi:gliding motility-associated-like protein